MRDSERVKHEFLNRTTIRFKKLHGDTINLLYKNIKLYKLVKNYINRI